MDTIYYYYAYDTVSGDYYYGYVYDDGSYGYYTGLSASTGSETGGTWNYYVYDEYEYGYDTGVAAGTNYVYYYYDGETGRDDQPYYYENGQASGGAGLGSEFDYVDFGTGTYDYFGAGYYEADVPAASGDNIYYYYAYDTVSGDYYYGYVYDDGSYGYYVGQSAGSGSETGGTWNYYVYDVYSYGYDTGVDAGTNYVYYYYDGESGLADTPYYYENGGWSGSAGLGSEFDYVNFGTGTYDYFGAGYYEADATTAATDTIYYYYAYDTVSGDYYYGYVYDDGSYGYYTGLSASVGSETGGTWNYYVYDEYEYGYDTGVAAGTNYVYYYYDGETGRDDQPYYYENGQASGGAGLGSEFDYVDFGTGTYDYFGAGYYEADVPAASGDNIYYYYAYDDVTGDYYYGYVYDDGSYGYYVGQSAASGSETGGTWNYYVYDVYSYGYDTGVDAGTNYVYYYYDGETGLDDTPYFYENGGWSGSAGLGSEFDYVDFGNGNYDYFGAGYYEADYV